MASMNMAPRPRSGGKVFLKSQFLTKARSPPSTLSFAGQTVIITGSNVGIGFEACRQMLDRGLTHLIMGVRSLEKGERAADQLRQSHPGVKVEVRSLDMCSYESIQAFAQSCASLDRLDKVILNAGIFNPSFKLGPLGHEESFQVNYLSTTLLGALMLPVLESKHIKGQQPSRLTIIGSSAGLTNNLYFRDANPIIPAFDDPGNYKDALDSYSNTKMCGQITMHYLAQRVKAENVIVNIVDPGLVAASGLHRNFPGVMSAMFSVMKNLTARSIEQGAWTYLDAVAVKGKESHGAFVVDWELHPLHPVLYTPEGKGFMERLWTETLAELKPQGLEDA